jgi:homoserine kinase
VQKIKIRLPATLTDFGVAMGNLGLALSLYTNIEISPRNDDKLVVEPSGEGSGEFAVGLRHPIVLGMVRVFQQLERAPLGVNIRVHNDIPLNSGLGAEVAFMVAGVLGANNLMGSLYNRNELIQLSARLSKRPHNAISAMLGGLTTHIMNDDGTLTYKTLPLTAFKVILAIPRQENYLRPSLSESVPSANALYNMQKLPMFLQALKDGDLTLLTKLLDDRLLSPQIARLITGYNHVAEVARLAGALGVTTSGGGTAMLIIAQKGHDRIAEAIENAFRNLEIPAKVLVLPLDTQGVVISMMQSG